MNADAFRHFYAYHFAENRKIWAYAAQLSESMNNWCSHFHHAF